MASKPERNKAHAGAYPRASLEHTLESRRLTSSAKSSPPISSPCRCNFALNFRSPRFGSDLYDRTATPKSACRCRHTNNHHHILTSSSHHPHRLDPNKHSNYYHTTTTTASTHRTPKIKDTKKKKKKKKNQNHQQPPPTSNPKPNPNNILHDPRLQRITGVMPHKLASDRAHWSHARIPPAELARLRWAASLPDGRVPARTRPVRGDF